MSGASARSYSAAFGVFLAYSALEACWTAMGRKANDAAVIDLPLAGRIRAALAGCSNLGGELNGGLRGRVAQFMEADDESGWPRSHDVLIMARAIRHLVARGIFTPWGGRAVSTKAAWAFQDLADAILAHSSEVFAGYVWPNLVEPRGERQ